MMLAKDGITVLDKRIRPGDFELISTENYFGFRITNKTGEHLFVEAEFSKDKIVNLIIRK